MNNYTPDTSSVMYAFVDGNKPRDEEEYLRLMAGSASLCPKLYHDKDILVQFVTRGGGPHGSNHV